MHVSEGNNGVEFVALALVFIRIELCVSLLRCHDNGFEASEYL